MASFLKKTTFAKPEAAKTETPAPTNVAKPKLGGGLGKKLGSSTGLGKGPANKPALGGSLLKKKAEPKEIDLEKEVKEENEHKKVPATKPKLGAKKSLINKKDEVQEKSEAPEIKAAEEVESTKEQPQEDVVAESVKEASEEQAIKFKEVVETELKGKQGIHVDKESGDIFINAATVEVKEEKPVEEKKTTKKKTSAKKNTKAAKKEDKSEQQILKAVEIDETKRISLEEMDAIMRPIVAPTTALWEQEKKDVLEALNNIKVEQDMNMTQVKTCLSDLDELKFEILPKQHDAETMYDGTKQNYDTVKAIAIANGNGGNAEARKAEGILACKNFVTPSGEVVDLHQYMLLIEERYKFYEKISDGVNFKKYSLVNYNNAIKAEKEGK